jgi:hypothetical protein
MAKQRRGQVLVIFAVLVPVVVLLFLFALGVAALLDVRAHAAYALAVATRAGARHVVYADYGEGQVRFADGVDTRVHDVFEEALALRTAGLGDTPENIAAALTAAVGYGTPESPWPSPFVGGRAHTCPTVAAQVWVWMFDVRVPVVSETEVR